MATPINPTKSRVWYTDKATGKQFVNNDGEAAAGFEFETCNAYLTDTDFGQKLNLLLDPNKDEVEVSIGRIDSVNAFDACFFLARVLEKYKTLNQGFRIWCKNDTMDVPKGKKKEKKEFTRIVIWFAYKDLHFFTEEEAAEAKQLKAKHNKTAGSRTDFVLEFCNRLDQYNRKKANPINDKPIIEASDGPDDMPF